MTCGVAECKCNVYAACVTRAVRSNVQIRLTTLQLFLDLWITYYFKKNMFLKTGSTSFSSERVETKLFICVLPTADLNHSTLYLFHVQYHAAHVVRHHRCVFVNYNWINQLSNTTIWWLDICCLLHRYQLHVSALMAIFRLIDCQQNL